MDYKKTLPFIASAILSGLVIINVLAFDLHIIRAADTLQVQYTPDDAYYYLTLARNFPEYGLWTFDSGHSVTSGFHPMWAYLLSLVHVVFRPTNSEFVRYGLMLSSLTTFVSMLVVWLVGLKVRNVWYMLVLALIVTSKNFAYNSISIVEWPLVVLFSSLYCICFYRFYNSHRTMRGSIILFGLGLGGSLARSDFGLLPFALFAASLILCYFSREKRARASPFFGVLGSAVGVVLIFLHNYIFTGLFLQSSAQMKAYWVQVCGRSYKSAIGLLTGILSIDRSILKPYILIPAILFLAVLLIRVIAMRGQKKDRVAAISKATPRLTMLIAAGLCVLGYTLLYYSGNASIQPWYTANLVAPVFVILVIAVDYIKHLFGRGLATLAVSVLVLFIVLSASRLYPVSTGNSRWPHQHIMLSTGEYLRQHKLDGTIGSWNAGIIAYYQGGTVVNLDGLVNNDIYEYATNNDLPTYLSKKGIKYIVDFENMLADETCRLKGGYDDIDFVNSLRSIKVFDDGAYYWRHMTLYQISN